MEIRSEKTRLSKSRRDRFIGFEIELEKNIGTYSRVLNDEKS